MIIKLPIYFRKGITLFKKSIQYSYKPRINEYLINDIVNNDTSLFISLIDFKIISDCEIAFCEVKRSHFFCYPPIMRGIIRIHKNDNKISLTGYLNWWVIWTICFLSISIIFNISLFRNTISTSNVLIVFILICYLILRLQYRLYNNIIKFLKRKYE